MPLTDSPELEAELRAAVADRVALREQELREERALLKKRIEANEKQLQQFDEDCNVLIDRELLDNDLSERHRLGLYPGALGTATAVLWA